MEVAIYALLATDTDETAIALSFVFEEDENTGQMQHEYVSHVPRQNGNGDLEDPQSRVEACYIC